MSEAVYKSSSLGWQVSQGLRRFGEWFEYRSSLIDGPNWEWPNWEWPDWNLPPIVGQVLYWGAIALVALWLLWLLFRALEPAFARWLEQEQKWVTLGGAHSSRPDESRDASYWWQQALAQAKQGQYKEACRSLYKATLQQLHDSQRLLHNPSRTDGEYLAQLAENRPLPRPYQLLIGTHERLMFGQAIASLEMFQRCRQAYEEIQKK